MAILTLLRSPILFVLLCAVSLLVTTQTGVGSVQGFYLNGGSIDSASGFPLAWDEFHYIPIGYNHPSAGWTEFNLPYFAIDTIFYLAIGYSLLTIISRLFMLKKPKRIVNTKLNH